MKVLGIDPGTATLGFGVVEGDARARRLVECGIIQTRAREPLAERLRVVYDGVAELLARHAPACVAVETAFVGRNAHSTISLSHARGVVLLACQQAGVPVCDYAPAMVKKTVVGRGAALKPQVAAMTMQLLRLAEPPCPADAADAVAIALAHLLTATRTAQLRALARTVA